VKTKLVAKELNILGMLCNKIKYTIHFFTQSFITCYEQALVILHLGENEIGPQGAQYLANALEQNEVSLFTCHPIDYLLFIHRHSPYLTLKTINLAMKESTILPMLYDETK
jgi:hypothetical protein